MRTLHLGAARSLDALTAGRYELPARDLTTHSVVVGMTGSGKTGLLFVMIEEALRQSVPVLMVDVKGDLPNLLLALPTFEPSALEPWLEAPRAGDPTVAEQARQLAEQRERELASHGIGLAELQAFAAGVDVRVLTPGSGVGEPLDLLSSLERRSPLWDTDTESARASVRNAVSLMLRLVGRDANPARSREHVMLSVLAERRLLAGEGCPLEMLLKDLETPPIETVGALPVDVYIDAKDRRELAGALNSLLAAPSLISWREGQALDVSSWLSPLGPRTPATVVSVAHLDDEERELVLGILLEEVLTWVRAQRGTRALRALVVFDEAYGFLPPYPRNPPTKRPLVALMKQARAFGVGVVIATQNPMDLDYRALSNAGFWAIGCLQTDADRDRVIEAMATPGGQLAQTRPELERTVKRLGNRWFLTRNVHSTSGLQLLRPRWAMTFMRGPMTRKEIGRAGGRGRRS